MAAKLWVDGRLVDKLAASVTPFDHGLLFGDGATVGTRLYAGRAARLSDHLARLAQVAEALSLPLPLSRAEFAAAVEETVAASGRGEGYVKIVVTRGAGMLGHDPRKCHPSVMVIVDDLLPYPPELRPGGLSLAVATSVVRHPGHLADWGGTLSSVTAVLAMRDALAAGCLDAVLLNPAGEVTGTTEGLLALRLGGAWRAPAVCPDPVMHAVLGEACAGLGEALDTGPLTLADVAAADEAVLLSSATGAIAVRRVGAVPLPTVAGPATQLLFAAVDARVRLNGPELAAPRA